MVVTFFRLIQYTITAIAIAMAMSPAITPAIIGIRFGDSSPVSGPRNAEMNNNTIVL